MNSHLASRRLMHKCYHLSWKECSRSSQVSRSFSSTFDVFSKLKDPADKDAASSRRRQPSEKVLKLVDDIMNLTLIEAADLCDLCQETLSERSGHAALVPGRTPFPHPFTMFGGSGGPPMQGFSGQPAMGGPPVAAAPSPDSQAASAEEPGKGASTNAKKDIVNLKLVSFTKEKKVAVVKEVRSITALGLKESKELVEEAPKVVKKGLTLAEADELKKKLEAAGAVVVVE